MFSKVAHAGHLPIAASDVADRWDSLYLFLIGMSVFFTVLVIGGMLFFAFKYRASQMKKPKYIADNHFLEITWTVLPTILVLFIFAWGWSVYDDMIDAPSDAYEVRVIGKQWLWQFQYDHGVTTTGKLYVPVNKPVKLIMTSDDVIHSMFIPNMRVKQDVVPGMYTTVWFESKVAGRHQIYCTEYCGTDHSGMLADLYALEEKDWKDWVRGKKLGVIPDAGSKVSKADLEEAHEGQSAEILSLAKQGERLMAVKGCVACHSADGSAKIGPSYKGLFGSKREFVDGRFVKSADENYLRRSIMDPNKDVVKGFNPVMPTFRGQITETEMNALIAYIKSVN